MTDIKPIETIYNGYRFRSRLEARWAVFFDTGKIKYEYEPEGFETEAGRYLPDFYLPELDTYVEVKRDTPEGRRDVFEKCEKSIVWGGPIKQIIILSDVPEGRSPDGGIWHYPAVAWKDDHPYWGWWFFHDGNNGVIGNISAASYPNPTWFLFDERNNRRRASIKAITDYDLHDAIHHNWKQEHFKYYSPEDHVLLQEDMNELTFKALRTARQARFEYGETPIIRR